LNYVSLISGFIIFICGVALNNTELSAYVTEVQV